MRIVRADERYRSAGAGTASWHCFSAGAHYDPDNVSYDGLVGCDEHLVDASAGFDWHGHAGVDIVSWVLAGTLRHDDNNGHGYDVRPGQVLHQSSASGIRHREWNASASDPLRFVQLTVLADAGPTATLGVPPIAVASGEFAVWRGDTSAEAAGWHVFVGAGDWQVGAVTLATGDSARGGGRLAVTGRGELLVCLLS